MATTMIHYDGELVAFASSLRVHFAPPLDQRPNDDPVRRFVLVMGAYARDVGAGVIPGPYDQQDAELYARTFLVPDDELAEHAHETDEQLAARFGVPVEQIAQRRLDALGGADT